MRIIIKNADFSVYGLADISTLMGKIEANYGGVNSTNKASVEAFLRALGADGGNAIWPKIKHLYMPCLALSTDSDTASLYDIITEGSYPKTGATYSVQIEDQRGVRPSTMSSTGEGIGYFSMTDGLTDGTMSLFTSFTRSYYQSLTYDSGAQVQLGQIVFKWGADYMICGIGSDIAQIAKPSGFTTPNWMVMSAKDSGSRLVVSADGETTSSILNSNNSSYFNLSKGYCCTSLCGVCEGLTAAECRTISTAIGTFVTDFGILNTLP